MARYWIADLHLGHEKVAKIRGFDTVEKHDETILQQLSSLKIDDEVWVLGDISSGKPTEENRALWELQEISETNRVKLHLIAGNHDSVSSIHRAGYKKQREWLEVFESVQQFGVIRLSGHRVLMSHYPFAGQGDGPGRGPERYREFRLPYEKAPLVHGHTHQSKPHMDANRNDWGALNRRDDTQQFCVSWDVKRGLVTEHDLNQWLEAL